MEVSGRQITPPASGPSPGGGAAGASPEPPGNRRERKKQRTRDALIEAAMGLFAAQGLAAYLRFVHDHDDEIIQVLAERAGVDPASDRRPRVLAAVIGSLVFLAHRDWRAGNDLSPGAMSAAFDAYADEVIPALAGHWA